MKYLKIFVLLYKVFNMAFNNYNNTPKTIHDSEDGDSQIYVGIKYLGIVGQQIDFTRLAEREALNEHTKIMLWLNELRTFYDLIESRTGLSSSETEVDSFEYKLNENTKQLERTEKKIKEKDKYEHWFAEIERMVERNSQVAIINSNNPYQEKRYLNNKKILMEVSRCHRELMRDANKRHLIMPEGVRDMKKQLSEEWLDRDVKKEF
jgi:hypothetical protein